MFNWRETPPTLLFPTSDVTKFYKQWTPLRLFYHYLCRRQLLFLLLLLRLLNVRLIQHHQLPL